MKANATCPKCASQDLFAIDRALMPDHESSNTVVPVTLTAHYGPTGEQGWLGNPVHAVSSVPIEVWVCARCAYVELYAKDLRQLGLMAEDGSGGVRRVSSSKGKGST
jgi:predicted nucleic-acid-binding Zn-ribbon protein